MEYRIRNLEQKMADQSQLLGEQSIQLGELLKMLKEKSSFGDEPNGEKAPGGAGGIPVDVEDNDSNQYDGGRFNSRTLGFTPKLEFPVFDGSNPRVWMKKCLKYFKLCKNVDNQRVDLASMYMVGRAESWFNRYIAVRKSVDWEEFVIDLCARFKEEIGSNVVEEFNKLQQTHSIDQYLDAFEGLRALMILRNPLLPDQYFLENFIGGLKPILKPLICESF